jgi:hypothetical protein
VQTCSDVHYVLLLGMGAPARQQKQGDPELEERPVVGWVGLGQVTQSMIFTAAGFDDTKIRHFHFL